MGKILVIVGVILVIAGLIIHYAGRIPFLGKLPGDIIIERPNFRLYFPLMTSILLSIVISLILFFISKYKN
jgi:hypothetical protein